MLKCLVFLLLVGVFVQATNPPASGDEADKCKKQGQQISNDDDALERMVRHLPYPEDRIKTDDPAHVPHPAPPKPKFAGWDHFKDFLADTKKPTTYSPDEVQAWIEGARIAASAKVPDLDFLRSYEAATGDKVTHNFNQDLQGYLKAKGLDPKKLKRIGGGSNAEAKLYTHPDLPGKLFKVPDDGTARGVGNAENAIHMAYTMMLLRIAVQKAEIPLVDYVKVEHIGNGFFVREFEDDSIVRPATKRVSAICGKYGIDFDEQYKVLAEKVTAFPGIGGLIATQLATDQNFVSEDLIKKTVGSGKPRVYVIYDLH